MPKIRPNVIRTDAEAIAALERDAFFLVDGEFIRPSMIVSASWDGSESHTVLHLVDGRTVAVPVNTDRANVGRFLVRNLDAVAGTHSLAADNTGKLPLEGYPVPIPQSPPPVVDFAAYEIQLDGFTSNLNYGVRRHSLLPESGFTSIPASSCVPLVDSEATAGQLLTAHNRGDGEDTVVYTISNAIGKEVRFRVIFSSIVQARHFRWRSTNSGSNMAIDITVWGVLPGGGLKQLSTKQTHIFGNTSLNAIQELDLLPEDA